MILDVYSYESYRSYLFEKLRSLTKASRGSNSLLAKILDCRPSYVTKLRNNVANISLEQAQLLNEYFQHTVAESRFFLTLVQYERAGSESLRLFFKAELDELRAKRSERRQKFSVSRDLPFEVASEYYSAWYYGAVHIATAIPGYRTAEAISRRLSIPLEQTKEVIEFLSQAGLLQMTSGEWLLTDKPVVSQHQPLLEKAHHRNMRLKAIRSIQLPLQTGTHYSSLLSISRETAEVLRKKFAEDIQRNREICRDSNDEELYGFCLDFFEV